MLERTIAIVDDNTRVTTVHIPAYRIAINRLKGSSDKWKNYLFNFIHFQSMIDAITFMSEKKNCIDVLLVDYDFKGESTFLNGTEFVKYVRNQLNRYCQIVFYTMHGFTNIDREALVALINSDVFMFVDKADDYNEVSKVLFEAATARNPIVESLEYFYSRYNSLLCSYEYTLNGEKISFEEIIGHIRMDDEIGRTFINKLLQKAVLREIQI